MMRLLRALMVSTGLAATPALAGPTGGDPVQVGDLVISGAFARATPPRAAVGAAYLTIRNQGTTADRLLAATSAQGREVQIHTMTVTDGVMTMRPLTAGLPLPPAATQRLAPGGAHLMVMGLTEPLVQGDRLDLGLSFERAGRVSITVPVLALNARSPDAAGVAPVTAGAD